MLDLNELYSGVASVIIGGGGLVGATVAILGATGKLKKWQREQALRSAKLDKILSGENIKALAETVEHLADSMRLIRDEQDRMRSTDSKQDEAIRDSIAERGLLLRSLLAICEHLIEKQGANGAVHAVREELKTYILQERTKHHG